MIMSLNLGTGCWVEATNLLQDNVPAFAGVISLFSKDGPNTVLLNLGIHAYGVVLKSRLEALLKEVKTGDLPAAADSY